ncbi:hypothetical protein [Arenimonas sp.]|uniref:hypothetical protein n=1 Tax=Arenimonas sp. TaxID=1872635 RepID=UPI0039E4E3CB
MDAERVKRIDTAGVRAWRKRYEYEPRRWRLALLRRFVDLLGIESLRPPAMLPPAQARATEKAMIQRLQGLGCLVPQILAEDEEAIVISDLGATLASACKRESDAQARANLVASGFDALADLHAQGGWLNQAFARNLTVSDGRIGFIDLDQDPTTVMSLEAAQARDLLLYAYSTARFFESDLRAYSVLVSQPLAREPQIARQQFEDALRRLSWLCPLAPICGRDLRALAKLIALREPASARRWNLIGGLAVVAFAAIATWLGLALFR